MTPKLSRSFGLRPKSSREPFATQTPGNKAKIAQKSNGKKAEHSNREREKEREKERNSCGRTVHDDRFCECGRGVPLMLPRRDVAFDCGDETRHVFCFRKHTMKGHAQTHTHTRQTRQTRHTTSKTGRQ